MKQSLPIIRPAVIIAAIFLLNTNRSNAQSFDIYVFDVKTGTAKQVTSIPDAGEYNVTWSNNGKKMAHDVVGPEAAPYNQTIFVTDVQTDVSTQLTGAEGGNDAAWSPDGKTIAFDDYHYSPQSIFTVPSGGGTRALLRYNSHHASWNPQSIKIAFDDNYGYIGTKDINTGIETFVTYYGDRPAWSPNGQYIAFDGWSWVGGGVWVIKVDSSGNPQGYPVQLTTSGYGPTWKNNSKEIVFVDWPDGDPNLYSIAATGGVAKKIAGRVGGFDKGDYDPAYSNNGQYIAWSSYTDMATANSAGVKSDMAIRPTENKPGLQQNYPNPFTDKTTIDFNIAQATHVSLSIYNLSGQKVKTLADADYMPGAYHLQWNGKTETGQNVANGIYLYQLQTENGVLVKKMILKK